MPQSPTEAKQWELAIDAARDAHILMFCSASDVGQFAEHTYPHNCRPNITFRVGAAMQSGQIWEKVPDAGNLDFALPGYQVFFTGNKDDPKNPESPEKLESHTGSSVATALASGLAALVLECVRVGFAQHLDEKYDGDYQIVEKDLDNIRQRDNLRKAFLVAIGTSDDTSNNLNKFVMVDKLFKPYTKTLIDVNGESDRLDIIVDLARRLLCK